MTEQQEILDRDTEAWRSRVLDVHEQDLEIAQQFDGPIWFWLSFCDPEKPAGQQFVGVSLVEARSMPMAITVAHQRGCNPGGSVSSVMIPESEIDESKRDAFMAAPKYTLLSKVDLERLNLLD